MEIRVAEAVVIESLRFVLVTESECELAGTLSSDAAQQELGGQLERLHARIQAKNLSAFKVDVRRLEFVNSSAIRLFVNWISRAQSGGYKLTFLIDRTVTWHRLSFSALRSLSPDTVELIDGSAAKPPQGEARQ